MGRTRSKRHGEPVRIDVHPRRIMRGWMWVAIVPLTGSMILAFTTRPAKPPIAEAPSFDRFLPTVERREPSPGPAPNGMVWIPGGDFSMGASNPSAGHDAVGMQATTDSRP